MILYSEILYLFGYAAEEVNCENLRIKGYFVVGIDKHNLQGDKRMKKYKIYFVTFFALFCIVPLFSNSGDSDHNIANFIIQLGVVIFVAKIAGLAVAKFNIPSVIGELLSGVVIGPYMLGGMPLPGFPGGLFPVITGSNMPVTNELYAIAMVASIMLLFFSGMETDLSLFVRYSLTGTIIGISGVVFSFMFGALPTAIFLSKDLLDPLCLFMGALSTATSVGITARIFSDNKKMDTPEGVTILAAAVIDDVIGIIVLAVVIGIAGFEASSGSGKMQLDSILFIALKAVGIWLGTTIVGMLLSSKISSFLKIFKSVNNFSLIAVSFCFLLSGFFEREGLSMIIGAYVMGMTLSKTDLTFVIQEELHSIYSFLVPIFFTVMGMMVNLKLLFSPDIIVFSLIFTVLAILSKVIGCSLPAFFTNFNFIGSLRIGLGMVPRGEVALITAGIGLSLGIIDPKMFGVCIMMTLITTLLSPPILNLVINSPKKGTRKDVKGFDTVETIYAFPSGELRDIIVEKVLDSIESEGFFVNKVDMERNVYQMRKDEVSFSMKYDENNIIFNSDKADESFIKIIVYEATLSIRDTVEKLKELAEPSDMKKDLMSNESRTTFNIFKVLHRECLSTNLKGNNKDEIISELVDLLADNNFITDKKSVADSVMHRELSMSTGMQFGIALPHGKPDTGVNEMVAAFGVKRQGVDFGSIDGLPSNIFVLLISPKTHTGPHIQFLSAISSILNTEDARESILSAANSDELWDILNHYFKN